MLERNDLMAQRLAKIDAVSAAGGQPYPNDFRPTHTGAELLRHLLANLEPHSPERSGGASAFRAVGRIIALNRKGKVGFLRLRDRSSMEVVDLREQADARRIAAGLEPRGADQSTYQVFVRRNDDEELFDALFKGPESLDVGDIIGVIGRPFRTKTGEPSLWACTRSEEGELLGDTADSDVSVRILTKSVRPLPEKFHGLTDKETRHRQRYVDLIVNDPVRHTFIQRAKVISETRAFLQSREFLEVETPMMHGVVGGAAARPFNTHHNALNIPLYLRIAPELYLKRLVVGGMERVFEINRNFRNEGISQQHNPEFTMLEFYQAYATYEDLMDLVEELLSGLAVSVCGSTTLPWGEGDDAVTLDLSAPFERVSVYDGLVRWAGLEADEIHDPQRLRERLASFGHELSATAPVGKLQMELFEAAAEPHLIQPTFVTDFPVEVSPLSRKKDADPRLTDRFELYMAGFEVANAFSELNDPVDQHERFLAQVQAKAGGDSEAMDMDYDYIRALEYGMPPTAGCGIGMDRLVMVLTNTPSIREVILFPLLRPERPQQQQQQQQAGEEG